LASLVAATLLQDSCDVQVFEGADSVETASTVEEVAEGQSLVVALPVMMGADASTPMAAASLSGAIPSLATTWSLE